MKYIVLGGAGYIGSHLVNQLHHRGHDVVVFDNLTTGRKENVPSHIPLIWGDIRNKGDLIPLFDQHSDAECIFHFAALKSVEQSMSDPEIYAESNISGAINVLNMASKFGVRNFVFSSTAAVYGTPQTIPVDEDHPTNPESFYGFTKLKIEELLHWYSRLTKINYAVLRYFNAAGYSINGEVRGKEKEPANLLPIVMEVASGVGEKVSVFGKAYNTHDGTGVRDYIHVDDLARAHVLASDYIRDKRQDLTVNLGTENGYSVLDVINRAKIITGKDIPYEVVGKRPGDPAYVISSSRKAYLELAWKPEHSMLDTILDTMWNVYKG